MKIGGLLLGTVMIVLGFMLIVTGKGHYSSLYGFYFDFLGHPRLFGLVIATTGLCWLTVSIRMKPRNTTKPPNKAL